MINFYTYNDYFITIIDANVIILYINSAGYNNISIYKKQLRNCNYLEEIFRLENLNLNLFKIQKLLSQATQKINKITATIFAAKQKE